MNISSSPKLSTCIDHSIKSLNLDDLSLAAWLTQSHKSGDTVVYLHGQFLCKVYVITATGSTLYIADPDKRSKKVLRRLAKSGLLKHMGLPLDQLDVVHVADPAWPILPIDQNQIDSLIENRQIMLGRIIGRGKPISTKTAWQVWTEAGARCMFAGCAKDLSDIPLYNKSQKVGYLAHIIASDPNGPRGNQQSHALSDDPDNIMLMCDAHHRLIDSFAASEYTAEKLNAMRSSHRDAVRTSLESLSYPRMKAVTLHANLANIPTYFTDSDLNEAILQINRAMVPNVDHHIRRYQRDDRRTPEFWVQYLNEHELDVQKLVSSFNQHRSADMDQIAVFPLHHVSTTILAGRIIGEARRVRVFQYHRQRQTWQWDSDATPQPEGMFYSEGLLPEHSSQVLITIELTASVDENFLPVNIADGVTSNRIPWVRIRNSQPDSSCIQHEDDLAQFMTVARHVINHVQDQMRAEQVHLIAISPASTVFCFGQMLQAGHHPTYTIYDRADRDSPFSEAFSITGHNVTASAGDLHKTVSIR